MGRLARLSQQATDHAPAIIDRTFTRASAAKARVLAAAEPDEARTAAKASAGTKVSSRLSPWSVCRSPIFGKSHTRYGGWDSGGSTTPPSARSRSATIQSVGSLMSNPS